MASGLVNLLNGRAAGAPGGSAHAATRHATLGHATTAGRLVDLHHDGVHDALELLLLGLELVLLSELVLVQPVQGLLHGALDLLLVAALELVLQLLLVQGVAHGEAVVLKAVLRLDLQLVGLVFGAELLCFLHHAVDLGLREAALLVGDRNLIGLARGLVRSADVQNAVGIDVVGHLDLRNTTWGWRDAIQVELAKQVVVLGHGTLALEDLNQHTRLVVGIGGEGLCLLRWDCCISLDKLGHDAAGGL
mmetsp:Transcript_15414/g.36333  ORF Transcript_15414/g.36333 Transcript_15414/m.36333 type:complete len:248 (+) Transcript_15414:135-878(+)